MYTNYDADLLLGDIRRRRHILPNNRLVKYNLLGNCS